MKPLFHAFRELSNIWEHLEGATLHDCLEALSRHLPQAFPWMPIWLSNTAPIALPLLVVGSVSWRLLKALTSRQARRPSEAGGLIFVCWDSSEITAEVYGSCSFMGYLPQTQIHIKGAAIQFRIRQPLLVKSGERMGIALLASVDGAAYPLSFDCTSFAPLNMLPNGAYEVELTTTGAYGQSICRRWRLIIGLGCPPAWLRRR
jgi:hypothetical protein